MIQLDLVVTFHNRSTSLAIRNLAEIARLSHEELDRVNAFLTKASDQLTFFVERGDWDPQEAITSPGMAQIASNRVREAFTSAHVETGVGFTLEFEVQS